jgi:hypothetical protein
MFAAIGSGAQQPGREFYEIRIYHYKDTIQEKRMDTHLQQALLPALHRAGIGKIGVFKPVGNDTLTDKLLYVLMPLRSPDQLIGLPEKLDNDQAYQQAGKDYINAAYTNAAYTRIESITLYAFSMAPQLQLPSLRSPFRERVYELRSYESATEKIFRNKVQMFNEGGEIALFKRLGFNAVFYAEVIAGNHRPNLMYMTSFENKAARDAHWKEFGADPEWKRLSALPEYQHNVSHIDIMFLRPVEYSEF